MKTSKKLFRVLILVMLVVSLLPVTALAAAGYVTVNDGTTQYATLDEAAAAATAQDGVVTYHIYGAVTATGTNVKYTPALAVSGASTVNLIGETSDAKITLNGVYYQRLSATGAELYAEGITFADARRASGEGTDPDPWEFCYIQPDCDSAVFFDCTFEEGIIVSSDTIFQSCTFDMKPQYYTEGNNFDPNKDYSTDHYALWIHNYGDIIVDDCTFKNADYGAIKSTWDMYNGTSKDSNLTLQVTNSTFDNCGNGGKHRPFHLDGAASLFLAGNTFNNSYTKPVENADTDYCEHIDIKTSPNGKGVDAVVNSECNPPFYYVIYTDGVEGEEVFSDQISGIIGDGIATPAFNGTPTRAGYTFEGWSPAVAATVTADVTYTAQWKPIAAPATPAPAAPVAPTATPAPAPKTGDATNLALLFALVAISGVGVCVIGSKQRKAR